MQDRSNVTSGVIGSESTTSTSSTTTSLSTPTLPTSNSENTTSISSTTTSFPTLPSFTLADTMARTLGLSITLPSVEEDLFKKLELRARFLGLGIQNADESKYSHLSLNTSDSPTTPSTPTWDQWGETSDLVSTSLSASKSLQDVLTIPIDTASSSSEDQAVLLPRVVPGVHLSEVKDAPIQKEREVRPYLFLFDLDGVLWDANVNSEIDLATTAWNNGKDKEGKPLKDKISYEKYIQEEILKINLCGSEAIWREQFTAIQKIANIGFVTHNHSKNKPYIEKLLCAKFGNEIYKKTHIVCGVGQDKNKHIQEAQLYFFGKTREQTRLIEDSKRNCSNAQAAKLIPDTNGYILVNRFARSSADIQKFFEDLTDMRSRLGNPDTASLSSTTLVHESKPSSPKTSSSLVVATSSTSDSDVPSSLLERYSISTTPGALLSITDGPGVFNPVAAPVVPTSHRVPGAPSKKRFNFGRVNQE
jgi:hypothetical protein